jgi:hypothetical protein
VADDKNTSKGMPVSLTLILRTIQDVEDKFTNFSVVEICSSFMLLLLSAVYEVFQNFFT